MILKIFLFFMATNTLLMASSTSSSQDKFEKEISAVVRNKIYYKSGHIEIGGFGGLTPYDSLLNTYMIGGRLNWHFSDHIGWEIADFQMVFPVIPNYTKDLVVSKNITDLQLCKNKMLAATSLLLSPMYGKIRVFGKWIVFLDVFFNFGVGASYNEIVKVSETNPNGSVLRSSTWDPMFSFGVGFKLFLNKLTTLIIDMRDYVVYSELYGKKTLYGNYAFLMGVSFFIPPF